MLWEFVLTGGPCGGKTSILQLLIDRLRDLGYRVIVVPEAATIVLRNFPDIVHIIENNPLRHVRIQRAMMRIIASLEHLLKITISPDEKTVFIYDRHIPDAEAYMTKKAYMRALAKMGLDAERARDRFDGVLLLATAADGAEEFYSSANNAARYESPAQAREKDRLLRKAWTGAPRFAIIDNSTPFAEKMERAWKQICAWLGLPIPIEYQRKFLLATPPPRDVLTREATPVVIEQVYLKNTAGKERIRRRGRGVSATYYHTHKEALPDGGHATYDEAIDATGYLDLLSDQDPNTSIIHKVRYCFVHENQYCELDDFGTFWVLEVRASESNTTCTPPPWLTITREVTTDPAYSNYEIAKALKRKGGDSYSEH